MVGFNAAGAPLFFWPFGRRRLGRLQVVEFLGGKHANFNMALWRCDVAAQSRPPTCAVLARLAGDADLLRLTTSP